jgi:hypothetical protein
MTANTLTATYDDLRKEVAFHLGWNRGTWSADRESLYTLILNEGYRQFLYPEPLPGENKSHNWSFLYPMGPLQLLANFTGTGTVDFLYDGTDFGITLDITGDDYWPANSVGNYLWVDANTNTATPLTDPGSDYYLINDISSDLLTITVDGVVPGTDTTSPYGPVKYTSFRVERRFYDLPDDFGGMVSDGFTYRRDEPYYYPDIKIIGEGQIRAMDSVIVDSLYPRLASITPVPPVQKGTGEIGESTRWRVTFWPRAATTYELEYRYHAIPPALSKGTNIYHYGGAEQSSTITAAVIDVAFQKVRSSMEKHEQFLARLRQSVLLDRRNHFASYVGQGSKSIGDPTYTDELNRHRRATPTANVTTPW